ncbi:hypothetical protein [Mucilaginibacter glaciei]|uniref:Carboxypeptidase-like protein n=1 Tax=Mucilaginibacter glaciei TaxID=2772109 RepID=A0A926NMZ5_9SPHI|nr:hypothetical protein [Mucilaginibacter glaciei]MBD1392701.1 hypothetical protein [Mucilaginibacter glaciei]
MLRWIIFLGIFLCVDSVFGQSKLKGRVFENKTRIGLADVWVTNLNTKQFIVTDNNGRFNIPAKAGDILSFKGFAYKNDTSLVINMAEKEVFLEPKMNELAQVNIIATTAPKMNTYYDPLYHGQSVIVQRDKKTGWPIGGIIIRMWYWKKDEHKKARLEQQEHTYEMMDRITAVFTPQIIGKYIPLKDEELADFIEMYTPNVKVFSAKSFQLVTYLNDCYKLYQSLPPDKRQPERLIIN